MNESQNIEWKPSWHDDYLLLIIEDIPNKIRNAMEIICDVQLLGEGKKILDNRKTA